MSLFPQPGKLQAKTLRVSRGTLRSRFSTGVLEEVAAGVGAGGLAAGELAAGELGAGELAAGELAAGELAAGGLGAGVGPGVGSANKGGSSQSTGIQSRALAVSSISA